MVCKKCGAELAEGAVICEQCGQIQDAQLPVTETPAAETPAEQTFTLNTEGEMPEKKLAKKDAKKTKLMTRLIAGAVALAILVTCVLGFAVFEWGSVAANLFNQLKSPEAYSQTVEADALKDDAPKNELGIIRKSLVEYYAGLKQGQEKGGVDGYVRLELGKDMAGLLQAFVPETAAELLKKMESLEITVNGGVSDSDVDMALGLELNDTELAQIRVITDMMSGMLYMGLPGLAEEYIAVNMVQMSGGSMDVDVFTEAMDQAAQLAEELPSEKEFAEMLDTFIMKAMAELDDVEKESRTVTAGGVQQSVTVLKTNISQRTIKKVAIAVLKEAKKNDTFHELVITFANYAQQMDENVLEMNKEYLVGMIDSALESVNEMEATKDKLCTLETYVNSKGEVCGRSLKMKNTDMSVTYLTTASGSKVGFKLEVKSEEHTLSLSGSGTKKGDKLTGTYNLKLDNQKLLVLELKDFNSVDGTGVYRLKLGKDALDLLDDTMSEIPLAALADLSKLEVELTAKAESLQLALLLDSEVMVSLSVGGKAQKAPTIAVPDKTVNADDALAMQKWLSGLDGEALLGRLEEAGLSQDFLQSLMGSVMG